MRAMVWLGFAALLLATPTPPTEDGTPTEVSETPTPTPEWLPHGDFELLEHDEPMLYPCMDCHADEVNNPTPRGLTDMHDDILLQHGPASRWCLDCHNLNDRDRLKLASGETIAFGDSSRLCGQCHGFQLRDWKVGVHGKVTGNMFGTRVFRTCVDCHDPHRPQVKPRTPKPAPVKPSEIQPKKNTEPQSDVEENGEENGEGDHD